MTPLRLLFISPYLPSLIRVRPYNLLKYLARRGHDITLLALQPAGEDASALAALRTWCRRVETVDLPRWRPFWNGLQALPGRTPFQAAYSRSPAMSHLIRQTLAGSSFDLIHIEHLRGAELAPAVQRPPVVFDSVDSISLLFEQVLASGPNWRSRLMAWLDLARTRRYEGRLLERFNRVLVTSVRDRDALAQLAVECVVQPGRMVQPVGPPFGRRFQRPGPGIEERLVVLPNGVDLDYFTPLNAPRDPASIIFSGKMSYHANIAAALDLARLVLPFVWQQVPEARLVLAGKDPPAELTALAADPRITVTGTVPDLRPCLGQATLAVMPMRYSVGIQNKVLEAMAMSTPVVSTPQAVAALQVTAGRDALVADTPQAMAQAVIELLTDEELRRQVGQAGRRYVETHHDWRVTAENLEGVYRDTIAANGR